MDFERCTELEAQFKDGRLTVRDFVKGLAKSSFYKKRLFEGVAPQRGIELNFKHLLGRAPENQAEVSAKKIELLSSSGYDSVIDSIVDSAEYLEVFGSDVVPYARSWSSPADLSTAAFPLLAALSRSFAGSDSARRGSPALTRSLASGNAPRISVPSQACWSASIVGKYFLNEIQSQSTWHHKWQRFWPMRGDAYVTFGLAQREQEKYQRCPGDTVPIKSMR